MSEIDSAALLTVGPRGRRLLWSVIADDLTGPAWLAARIDRRAGPATLVGELKPAVDRAFAEPRARTTDDLLGHCGP